VVWDIKVENATRNEPGIQAVDEVYWGYDML
jgi:hypothetical protein